MKFIGVTGVLLCAFALSGCGGSGGSSSGVASGTGRAAVLLTDGPREDYAHIWATIYHVELIPQTGAPVVLYDNTAGTQIDLRTLYDSSGQRFSFLGSAAIPAGVYTAINVTIAPTLQLFANGATTGTAFPVDSSVTKNSAGNAVITDTFHSPKTLGATTSNLIVDFNLAHFIIRDSKVIPVVEDGGGNGLNDPNRHNKNDYRGVISNLTGTAPALTFTLTTGGATISSAGTSTTTSTVTVVTSASTAIYGPGVLTNGDRVAVSGTLDTTTQNLVATQIEICPTGRRRRRWPARFYLAPRSGFRLGPERERRNADADRDGRGRIHAGPNDRECRNDSDHAVLRGQRRGRHGSDFLHSPRDHTHNRSRRNV